ncbi:MAG TPA: hypothetical protein VK894_01555, partial [Jiangellales bacterium]|nr:hypothetical protein [Jiangellales bacterium]
GTVLGGRRIHAHEQRDEVVSRDAERRPVGKVLMQRVPCRLRSLCDQLRLHEHRLGAEHRADRGQQAPIAGELGEEWRDVDQRVDAVADLAEPGVAPPSEVLDDLAERMGAASAFELVR